MPSDPRLPDISDPRPRLDGKFVRVADDRFLIKGVSYGPFAPARDGHQFPEPVSMKRDFQMIARAGLNTIRTYTPPTPALLDEAQRHGLRVMAGIPWMQHVAFLEGQRLRRDIRREIVSGVRAIARHPALLLVAVGNEISPAVVRWHGREKVEKFLHELYDEAKSTWPDGLFTYVNYPPTEYLTIPCFDVCAFNVYLHRESELRAYLARLQHIAGSKPLLLAEAGADSIREGEQEQAAIVSMHMRAAYTEGACGAIAFAWTDEWWRGGYSIDDWAFGLVNRERRPKPALQAVAAVVADAPFGADERTRWPKVSVVICAYNAESTLDDCLSAVEQLTYPSFDVIVIDDGSRDLTAVIASRYARVTLVQVPQGGLSQARNVGLAHATGEIVAYTDADVRVDPDWLTYLVQPMLTSDVVASGGPNVVPADDPWMAQCIARAPGGPTQVLLDDRVAEHVPGCNMAFHTEALAAIGGFNPVFVRAGDDVDVCWRLQARGWKIGFAPSALVWHHHRTSVGAYWRQQIGYGEGETWLQHYHPEKFVDSRIGWRGRIYSPLPFVRSLSRARVFAGVWGSAPFPSVYHVEAHPMALMPQSLLWQGISLALLLVGGIYWGASSERSLLFGVGVLGLLATWCTCAWYAIRSDVATLPAFGILPPWASRIMARVMIAWLHVLQPLARARGRLRGMLVPPEVPVMTAKAQSATSGRPGVRRLWDASRLLIGKSIELRFWSERWMSNEGLLTGIVHRLRTARAVRRIEIDDGWHEHCDLSLGTGRFMRLHLRALVEDHGAGRCLFRVALHLRPTASGLAWVAVFAAFGLLTAARDVAHAPIKLLIETAIGVTATMTTWTIWSTAQALVGIGQVIEGVAADAGMAHVVARRARNGSAGALNRDAPPPALWVPEHLSQAADVCDRVSLSTAGRLLTRDTVGAGAEFAAHREDFS